LCADRRKLNNITEMQFIEQGTVAFTNQQVGRRLPEAQPRRPRGRPAGGGISAQESREAFLDAAERSLSTRGYRASTMEVIAREAGYSRGNIYRHFPTRECLVQALAQRTAQRNIVRILERLPDDAEPVSILVEGMVIAATELGHDPMFKTISQEFEDRTVADMLANDAALTDRVELVIEQMLSEDNGTFRPSLRPKDLAQFLISTAISMLSGNIPGVEDPEVARRYIDAFVLPAVVSEPPALRSVFPDGN
jgi:AcrR family transcriptional regulator